MEDIKNYCKRNLKQAGYYICESKREINFVNTRVIKKTINHSIKGDRLSIRVDLDEGDIPDTASGFSTADKSVNFNLPTKNVSHIPSDMVYLGIKGYWAPDNDPKLSTIASMSSGNDLSPDMIYYDDQLDYFIVLEIATNRGNSLDKVFEYKRNYYEHYLTMRANYIKSKVFFFCLVISPTRCVTNVPFSFSQLIGLRDMMTIGHSIILYLQTHGINPKEENDFLTTMRDLKLMIGKMSDKVLPDGEKPIISDKMMNSWDVDFDYVRACDNWISKKMITDAPDDKDWVDKCCKEWDRFKVSMQEGTMIDKLVGDIQIKEMNASLKKNRSKPFVQFSLMLPNEQKEEDHPKFENGGSAIQRLWKLCVENRKEKPEFSVEDMVAKARGDWSKTQYEKAKKLMKERFRVEYSSLNEVDVLKLAEDGIRGKIFRTAANVVEKKEEAKSWFDMSYPTFDVDDFINGTIFQLLSKSSIMIDDLGKNIRDLEDKAYNALSKMQSSSVAQSFVGNFIGTKLGQTLLFWDRVFEEVNLSLNYYTRAREMLYKKVKGYNAWILMKANGKDKSSFFSICLLKQSFEFIKTGCFRDVQVNGNYYIIDFVSTDKHRIGNMLESCMKSCSMLAYWCDTFKKDPMWVIENPKDYPDIIQHFALNFLVYAEAREQTSIAFNLLRYSYMEVMKGSPIIYCNPLKLSAKFDNRPRSRLIIWLYKRYDEVFKKMFLNRPTLKDIAGDFDDYNEGEEDVKGYKSGDDWTGLLSIVTKREVPSFEIVLELMYLGTWHNKDQNEENQGYKMIFNKIILNEIKMRKAEKLLMGYKDPDPDEIRAHEFSKSKVAYCSLLCKVYLDEKFDNSWDDQFYRNLTRYIRKYDVTYFATFKASAILHGVEKYKFKESQIVERQKARQKCLESISELLSVEKIGELPLMKLEKLLDDLETRGFIFANLFKKLQLNGAREIFVLDMKSRLVIAFLETCSKVVCDELDEEMLTKGDQKSAKIFYHNRQVAEIKGEFYDEFTVTNSSDAKQWCQQFVMPNFAVMLSKIFDKDLSRVLIRILNLVTNKRLELPETLVAELMSMEKSKVQTTKEEIKELKAQLLGISKHNDLIKTKGERLMHNRSNMMQGILHYTSSLYHAIIIRESVARAREIVETINKKKKWNLKIVITAMVSSDDSLYKVTILFKKNDESQKKVARSLMIYLSEYKRLNYTFYNIKDSDEKSTNLTMNPITEFNSVFYVSNKQCLPKTKAIYAAMSPAAVTRLESRQIQMSETRKAAVESGCSSLLCSIVQHCQMRIHYRNLGATCSITFRHYTLCLLDKFHPSFGAFLLEPEAICGVFSYDFAHYIGVMNITMLNKIETTLLSKEKIQMEDESGRPVLVYSFAIGGRSHKYKSFIENMKIPENWRDIALKNPEMLVRAPETEDEIFFHLRKKVLTPSSAEAFMFNSRNALASSAVYILNEFVIKVRDNRYTTPQTKYISLIACLEEMKVNDDLLDDRVLDILFPAKPIYDIIITELSNSKDFVTTPQLFDRAVRMRPFTIPKSLYSYHVSLFNLAAYYWFDKDINASRTAKLDCLELYRSRFPWLKMGFKEKIEVVENGEKKEKIVNYTIEDTLKDPKCPFSTPIDLIDFFKSLNSTKRTIQLLAPIKFKETPQAFVKEIIRYNYMRGFIRRSDISDRTLDKQKTNLSLVHTRLTLALLSPETLIGKQLCVWKALDSVKTLKVDRTHDAYKTASEQDKILYLMHLFRNSKLDFFDAIDVLKRGVLCYWRIPQKYDKTQIRKWTDEGELHFKIDGIQGIIVVTDNYVNEIIVNELSEAFSISKQITQLIKEMRYEAGTPLSKSKYSYWLDLETGTINQIRKSDKEIMIMKPQGYWVQDIDRDLLNYELEIEDNKLKIKIPVYMGGEIRMATLLSYNPLYRAVDKDSIMKNNLFDLEKEQQAWLRYERLSANDVLKYLRQIITIKNKSKNEKDRRRGAVILANIVSSIKDRAKIRYKKEIIKEIYEIQDEATQEDYDNLNRSLLGEVSKMDEDLMGKEETGDHNDNLKNDASESILGMREVFDEQDREALSKLVGKNEFIHRTQNFDGSVTVHSYHPFWDDYLDLLDNSLGETISYKIILTNEQVKINDNFLNELFNLDKRKPQMSALEGKYEEVFGTSNPTAEDDYYYDENYSDEDEKEEVTKKDNDRNKDDNNEADS